MGPLSGPLSLGGILKMRVFSYDRTSVDDWNKVSNDAQYLEICRKLASEHRLEPKRFSDRGFSGGNGNRPGLQALEHSIQESDEKGELHIWRYDRLFRNARLALEFMQLCKDQNVEVISVSEPIPSSTASFAMKQMFVSLLFINAELQRSSIKENIKSGLAYKRLQGKYMSSAVPFGYRLKEGDLVQDLVEAEAVKRLFELYLSQDGYGYQRLANQLNKEGFSFKGGKFKKHTICMILRNPVYFGQVKGGSFGEYQGDFTPIIAKADFDKAQMIRQSRQKKKNLASQRTYPLRKKLQCPTCSRLLSCRWSKSPSEKSPRYYYYCANRDCDGVMIRAEKIEEEVLSLLRNFYSNKTIYDAIQKELLSQVRSVNKSQQKQQKDFEAERKVVLQKFEDGKITLEEMKIKLTTLNQKEQPEALGYNKEEVTKALQQLLKLNKAPVKELFFDQIELIQVNRNKEITGLNLQSINHNILERM